MTAVSDACTRGFMHLELLTERATKLEASESTNKLDAQLCIVPDVSFNCDGRLTSVFLGATINAASISKGSDVLYPEVQIWRLNSMNSTRQDSQQIRLNPGDFSREGVLKYNLDPPICHFRVEMFWEYTSHQGVAVLSQCSIVIMMMLL